MIDSRLDQLLTQSRSQPLSTDPRIEASVAQLVSETRSDSMSRRSRRRVWFAIPVVALGALTLSAGALGTDAALTPDIAIPISYTTLSGKAHSCTITIDGGSLFLAKSKAAGDYLRATDWTGVGQKIYDRAVQIRAAEFMADANGSFEFPPLDSQLTATPEQLAADHPLTWGMATSEQTVQTVPESLVPSSDYTSQWQDTCSGRLV